MAKLNPHAQRLFDSSMTWTDALWDDEVALVRSPAGDDHHTVRNTVWYALGLYARGDVKRAERALWAVLRYQYDTPATVYHGTFKRSPLEPDPGDNPTEWRDYDPNWREFIGTVFLVILRDFEVSEALRQALWASLHLAAEGAYSRDVNPAYTNIALMSALLLDHVGAQEENEVWRLWAAQKARAVYNLFNTHDTFWEYNSPTYYGTDLYALALWRAYGLTDIFTDLGSRMEAALWRDIGAFYHADLRNLCGPYDRSYGMDMTRYLALVGLYIALEVPPEDAPLPDPSHPFDHAHDYMFGPLVTYVGTVVPDDVRPHLLEFQGEGQLTRTVEPGRVATAFLSDTLMLGAETPHPSRLPNEQFHAATAHWRLGEGIGWLRVTAAESFSAEVSGLTIKIDCPAARQLSFVLEQNVDIEKVDHGTWNLSGLEISLEPVPATVATKENDALVLEAPQGTLTLHFNSNGAL